MFCRHAMSTDVITAGPDQTIRDALALLARHRIRAVPVVDAEGHLVGQFGLDAMLASLLPTALTVDHHDMMNVNMRLDYLLDATPNVAKHLHDLLPMALSSVMNTKVQVVHRDTPLWEGIRLLVQQGSPIPVVDETSHALVGLLSSQGATGRLMELIGESR
ncbi:MAG: CBS domain-containing protein [Candidatus Accumulibacter sp.]|uniref:CBS domain-containing protein n=1 Tax=Accumulibacter sp. TaxID=2053492 RepID=UPI0019D86367|nr:CBS domain-containing protein [Accumulibacter sp.]MBE2259653.1 CBS domain-containing protein [Paracoccaceae bacterium]MCB1941887.1 CBS domain-containing protein [Accumulibacter sp.]MCP5247411.1 CBS domain-containing protein [Accumulibacter sp.]HRE18965.1 CBS domain-containing protein [Rhodocyclaceae bacterium]